MNLTGRVGAYIFPPTSLWAGTVSSYDAATFTLVVATTGGNLANVAAGMAVLVSGTARYVRIKSLDAGTSTLVLAENPLALTAGEALIIYGARFPFTRYQRVITDGTVYKDWDIAWPGQYAAMPPRPVVVPEVVVADVDEDVTISALSSAAMSPSGAISSYGWSAGTDGVITGSGGSVSVHYTSAGFRYLRASVTDDQGTVAYRYIPCWIGLEPTPTTGVSLNWRPGNGWQADIEIEIPLSYTYSRRSAFPLQRSPVALADLDTGDVLFYGFVHPQGLTYTYERERLRFTALSPLAYLNTLYSYPFLVATAALGAADEWAEVYSLTLQRAIWYLLYWHSNITQLANVFFESTDRSIEGQEFSAGTLLAQLTEVSKAAFWQPRGWRTGGFSVVVDPLYNSLFSSLATLTLNAADVAGEITRDLAMDWISEARLMGIYYAGGWVPLIVRAPAHPEDIGRPEEITGLAPLNSTELRSWASRHLALAQEPNYRLDALVDVDPAAVYRLVLPDATAIAPETVRCSHNAEGLHWSVSVDGRSFGSDVTTTDEDPPPEVIVPPPDYPPIEPPVPPIPPYGWGDGSEVVLVVNDFADSDRGYIFRTGNFTDADPVWENITPASWTFVSGLCTEPVRMIGVKVNQVTQSVWVTIRGNNNRFAVIMSKDALTTTGTPTWVLVPHQTGTTPNVTYTSSTARHPRVLFDDTLTCGPTVAIRMVEGNASGAIVDDNELYMLMLDDNLSVISLTSIGESDAWPEAAMVEFNDDATGFLSYHTYYSGGWQIRRCNVPFGTALAGVLACCIGTNRPAWLESDPLVSVGPGYRVNGNDTTPSALYRLSEGSLASGTDDRAKILDFDYVEMVVDDLGSEQPFARNLGQRPGWLGITSVETGYEGLWTATNGVTFSVRGATGSLTNLAPRPCLYPNDVPYYAFFQNNYFDGSVNTEGRVYVWLVNAAALAERTGNLHSLVSGALWSTYPLCRAPLDVWWGRV